jgi:hypothetical protein
MPYSWFLLSQGLRHRQRTRVHFGRAARLVSEAAQVLGGAADVEVGVVGGGDVQCKESVAAAAADGVDLAARDS